LLHSLYEDHFFGCWLYVISWKHHTFVAFSLQLPAALAPLALSSGSTPIINHLCRVYSAVFGKPG
jgi:hypothetical protein